MNNIILEFLSLTIHGCNDKLIKLTILIQVFLLSCSHVLSIFVEQSVVCMARMKKKIH